MYSSDSDSSSGWNKILFIAVSKKQGKGKKIVEHDRCVEMQDCLDQGADINTVDENGNTVLHIAVNKGYREVVRFLRKRGARTNISNQRGYTAISLAEHFGKHEIASILRDPVERQSKQTVHRPSGISKLNLIDNERPSTSRGNKMLDEATLLTRMFKEVNRLGPVTHSLKRKPNANDELDEAARKRQSAFKNSLQLATHRDDAVDTGSARTNLGGQPQLIGNDKETVRSPWPDEKKVHAVSGLKRSLHGVVYQLKHLMLVLNRAWKKGYQFRLSTEMDAAEKFDDLVLNYRDSTGNEVHRFVQMKHKQDESKPISVSDLLAEVDGAFSVKKYFISWRKIQKHADFNRSRSKSFILCTNIGLDVKGLKDKNIDVVEEMELDEFLNIVNRTEQPPRYKLLVNNPSDNELYDLLRSASDVHQLAGELAERVCGCKDIYLNTDIIKCYHVALAQEVVDVENKKLFHNFIRNKDLSPKAEYYRGIFLNNTKQLWQHKASDEDVLKSLENSTLKLSTTFGRKCQLRSKPELSQVEQFSLEFVKLLNNASDDNVVKIDKQIYSKRASNTSIERIVADNIDVLAGHVLITKGRKIKFRSQFLSDAAQLFGNIEKFKIALKTQLGNKFYELDKFEFKINNFRTCTEEELSVRTELPDDIDNTEISNFLNEFILAVNQPNEIELGKMITSEIGAYSQFNLLNADFIGDSFQNAVLDWFKKTGKFGVYLETKDAQAFFNAIESELSSLITVGLNLPYPAELKKYGIKFESENKDLHHYLDGANLSQEPILEFISSGKTLLTALRVYQTISEIEMYKKNDSFIFIHFEKLLLPEIMDQVLRAFQSPHSHNLLVIDCESMSTKRGIQRLWNRLCEIIKRYSDKRMILITQRNNDLVTEFEIGYKTLYESEDDIGIKNLIKSSQQEILQRMVIKFQGENEKTSFARLLGIRNLHNIGTENLIDLGRIIDSHTLVKLIYNEEVRIGHEVRELGEIGDYYIARTIVRRVVIRDDILKVPGITDLFVISGIDGRTLEKLVLNVGATRLFGDRGSKVQPPLNEYIILDTGQESDHFTILCEGNRNRNIHWLDGGSGKLIWKQTFGYITNMVAYVAAGGDDDEIERPGVTYLTEDQLVDGDEQHRIVIISDTAGMGKSTVLTYLAQKIKENKSSSLVIRIDLTQRTSVLAVEKKNPSFDSKNIAGAVQFLLHKLMSPCTDLEYEIFKTIIMVRGEAALLFDGFDEISPMYEDTVIDLIEALAKLHKNKLFITTRPHASKALEKTLGIFSHTLRPFSRANQVDFLTKFWKKGISSNDFDETTEESLKEHAEAVMNLLAKSIDNRMQDFTGVPLQTRLVAEVFPYSKEEEQKRIDASEEIADSKPKRSKLPETIDIIDLFRRFVDEKYRIYCKEKKRGDDTNPAEIRFRKIARKIFLMRHQKMALDALLDEEIVKSLLNSQPEVDRGCASFFDKNEGEEQTGIITEVVEGKPQFIHRTFAEYFVATFLITTLKDDSRNQQVRKFFVAQLFRKREYKSVRAFLNHLLPGENNASMNESWELDLRQNHNAHHRTIYHVAAKERNVEILRFFMNRLCNSDDKTLLNITESYDQTKVHVATDRANMNDQRLLEEYKNAEGDASNINGKMQLLKTSLEQWANIDVQDKYGKTPLAIAVNVVDNFDVVKCLIDAGSDVNSQDKRGRTPLHRAANKNDNSNVVKYLLKKGADIHSLNENGGTPLHIASTKVGNLDTVKSLLNAGANIHSQDENGWTPLHVAAQFDNVDALKYSIQAVGNRNLQEESGEVLLHAAAIKADDLDVVKYLIEKGANINLPAKSGWTPLCLAAQFGNLDAVRYLIENGADVYWQEKDCMTPLHLAAASYSYKTDNVNVMKHLIEKGVKTDVQGLSGLTPLCVAAETGNIDGVKYLIEKGADINWQDDGDRTPLMHAAGTKADNSSVVKYLIENGAKIDSQDDNGWTPLYVATECGHLNVVKYLIKKGVDVNSQDRAGRTPLHSAVAKPDSLELVKYLIKKGANINLQNKDGQTPLHVAVSLVDNLDVVKYLIQRGADINLEEKGGWTPLCQAAQSRNLKAIKHFIEIGVDVDSTVKAGRTPLHAAAIKFDNLEVLNYLIEKGANINSQDSAGWTPLRLAVEFRNLDAVKYLVKRGAHFHAQTEGESTLLHIAAGRVGNLDVVKCLIENGADIHSQDEDGWTPLSQAALSSNSDIMEFLIQKGANVNWPSKYGGTVLHAAAAKGGHLDVVKYLIENGADIHLQDENGWTALSHAAVSGNLDAMEFLIQKGANVNWPSKYGGTVLHAAAAKGDNLDVVKYLIENGADIHSQDESGWTPLSQAAVSGNLDTMEFLIQKGANVNWPSKNGSTVLHAATSIGDNLDIVKYLIKKGANINSQAGNGLTPLHSAVLTVDNFDAVKCLIENGAEINSEGKADWTPLCIAANFSNLNVLKYLIVNGANVNSQAGNGYTPLHVAASTANNLDIVKCLIENGADINSQDKDDHTPLRQAAIAGNFDIMEFLIEKGANIDSPTRDGRTPLHAVIIKADNLEIVKYLIEKGANISSRDHGGRTLLYAAAAKVNDLDMVKYLIDKGVNINSQDEYGRTPLHATATHAKNLDVLRYLIKNGADIHSLDIVGRTPLFVAAKFGSLDTVKYLIKKGANINLQEEGGMTVLHVAADTVGNLDVVKYLIDKGADVNSQDKDRLTPLHVAAVKIGNLNIVKYLIEKGVNIDSQDEDDRTPLHTAVSEADNLDVIKCLIEKGANVNSQEEDGWTPLHAAAAKVSNLDVVKYLIEKGADVNSDDDDGRTPLHVAAGNAANVEVVKYLIEKGADINSREKDGWTPLHTAAAEADNLDIVRYLIAKGADINSQEEDGWTPLRVAASRDDNLDVVEFLIGNGASINS